MTWVRIPDEAGTSPEVRAISDSGLGAHVRCLAYSNAHLLDGTLDRHALSILRIKTRTRNELVRAGWWTAGTDHFQLVKWLKLQPSRQDTADRREATRERVKRHRNSVTSATGNADGTAPPSRPVPSRPEERESPPAKIHDGSGEPRDFDPTEGEMAAARTRDRFGASFATEISPNFLAFPLHVKRCGELGLDVSSEVRMFAANAKSKKKRSLDWSAEFDLWIERSAGMKRSNGRPRDSTFEDRPEKPAHPDGIKWKGGEFDERSGRWIELFDAKNVRWKWSEVDGKTGAWESGSLRTGFRRLEP